MADDPFKGIRLSEQASAPKLDQRLFERQDTPKAPSIKKPTPPQAVETDKVPLMTTPANPKSSLAPVSPVAVAAGRYDLNDEARYKASYYFSNDELLALDDLKLELHRDLDKKVTKNDLMRSALHLLLEDHQENREKSYVTRKIKRR